MTTAAPVRRRPSARAAVVLLVIGGLLLTSAMPLRRYLDVKASIADLRRQERVLDARSAELAGRKAELQTDAEVERLARERLGMVRPGETAFVITKPPAASNAAPGPKTEAPMTTAEPERPGFFSRWWDAVRTVVSSVR